MKQLNSPDPKKRLQAVHGLGDMVSMGDTYVGDRTQIANVIRPLLKDPDEDVRKEALVRLRCMGDDEALLAMLTPRPIPEFAEQNGAWTIAGWSRSGITSERVPNLIMTYFDSGDPQLVKFALAFFTHYKSSYTNAQPYLKQTRVLTNKVESSVHDLSTLGDVEQIRVLLNAHPELVSSNDCRGNTLLHYAARHGHKAVAELLLANGADVNAKDEAGLTPLHEAIGYERKEVFELLLANKADINARTNGGDTPLYIATLINNKDAVKRLLDNGADVNIKANNGETALFNAADNGYTDVAKLLLVNKAEVNIKDNAGMTPLQHAVRHGYKDVAKLLRQYGGRE